MSKLRRYTTTNAIFFVTAVTHNRTPHLSRHADTFREALRRQSGAHTAIIHAWVALPDHFHLLIELQKTPLDKFMHALKLSFSSLLSRKLGRPAGRVWQHRYWDHVIRSRKDYATHCDYIHHNPVRHGVARSPFEYEYSSAREYLIEGVYQDDWGADLEFAGNFGE